MPNKDTDLTLRVGGALQERRLDKYLHGRFSNYSRVMLQEVIKAGGVKVNGKQAKPSLKLNPDDLIEITLPELPKTEIPPEDIPLNILHEDDDIIVINKSADIIVHPARGNTSGTIANALAFHLAAAEQKPKKIKMKKMTPKPTTPISQSHWANFVRASSIAWTEIPRA